MSVTILLFLPLTIEAICPVLIYLESSLYFLVFIIMPNWYFEKKDLKNTPSYCDGIPTETEFRYRREGCKTIFDIGTELGLRYDAIATGVLYFHRFYMAHSLKSYNRFVTATCCLFLSGKVEETPKKCKDIIKAAKSVLEHDHFSYFGSDPKEEIMTMEKILLQTIKFDLQVQHPYEFLLKFAKSIKGDKKKIEDLTQMAWTFINDSLATTLCLQWEPDVIAVALMYLASRLTKYDITDWVGKPSGKLAKWWDHLVEDVSMDLLEDVCHQVLDLYSKQKKKETPSPPSALAKNKHNYLKTASLLSSNSLRPSNPSQRKGKTSTSSQSSASVLAVSASQQSMPPPSHRKASSLGHNSHHQGKCGHSKQVPSSYKSHSSTSSTKVSQALSFGTSQNSPVKIQSIMTIEHGKLTNPGVAQNAVVSPASNSRGSLSVASSSHTVKRQRSNSPYESSLHGATVNKISRLEDIASVKSESPNGLMNSHYPNPYGSVDVTPVYKYDEQAGLQQSLPPPALAPSSFSIPPPNFIPPMPSFPGCVENNSPQVFSGLGDSFPPNTAGQRHFQPPPVTSAPPPTNNYFGHVGFPNHASDSKFVPRVQENYSQKSMPPGALHQAPIHQSGNFSQSMHQNSHPDGFHQSAQHDDYLSRIQSINHSPASSQQRQPPRPHHRSHRDSSHVVGQGHHNHHHHARNVSNNRILR